MESRKTAVSGRRSAVSPSTGLGGRSQEAATSHQSRVTSDESPVNASTGSQSADFRSAHVALIGRPNSGKSSLLNAVLGEELSIVTPLPQTTRTNLRGVYSDKRMQLVFVDTPGLHDGRHSYNKAMTRKAASVLKPGEIDIVCYVVDLTREFGPEEDTVAGLVRNSGIPALVVFNKKDVCPSPQTRVDVFVSRYPGLAATPRVILSALGKAAGSEFLRALTPLVKPGPKFFPDDDLTDANLRFFAAECVRKYIIYSTREEVPHAAFVEVVEYRETSAGHKVDVAIHVETVGQRGIVVGPGGRLIEKIRRNAERDLAKLAQAPVSMRCHVKITPHWRDNPGFLREMGYS